MDPFPFELPTGANPAWLGMYRDASGRNFWPPNPSMSELHGRLIAWLRSQNHPMVKAHGAVPGRGSISNAFPHQHHRYFYQLDLAHAFQNVDAGRLARLLAGYEPGLDSDRLTAWLLRYALVRYPGGQVGLVTGAPASPDLFNHYCDHHIDRRLMLLMTGQDYRGMAYTRFADDLTFSSPSPIGERKRRRIRRIIEEAGFRCNDKKTKYSDITRQSVTICGVAITYIAATGEATMRPTRAARRRVRGKLHGALSGSVTLGQANGHMGGLIARTPHGVDSSDSAILALRQAQFRVLDRARPPLWKTTTSQDTVQLSWDLD